MILRYAFFSAASSWFSGSLNMWLVASCLWSFFCIWVFWRGWLNRQLFLWKLLSEWLAPSWNDSSTYSSLWTYTLEFLHLLSIISLWACNALTEFAERNNFDVHQSLFFTYMSWYIKLILISGIDLIMILLLLWYFLWICVIYIVHHPGCRGI